LKSGFSRYSTKQRDIKEQTVMKKKKTIQCSPVAESQQKPVRDITIRMVETEVNEGERVTIALRVPEGLKTRLEASARASGVPVNAFICIALWSFLRA
jgi:hypothetical protein